MARSTTAAPIRNTLGRYARPSQRPIPGYSLPESRALRRIIKLQREVERELGIWSAPECLAKIEEMEGLIRTHFGQTWQQIVARRAANTEPELAGPTEARPPRLAARTLGWRALGSRGHAAARHRERAAVCRLGWRDRHGRG